MANAMPHREGEAKAAAKLAQAAQDIGRRVITPYTIAAAQAAVVGVLVNSGGGPIGEAAMDVRVLRQDGTLTAALTRDLTVSNGLVLTAMLAALEAGYADEMDFQVTQFKGLTFKITDSDRADFHDYPIQGHTCAEITAYMHDSFAYGFTGSLASPLTGDSRVETLLAIVGAAVEAFGNRCGTAITEAYYAGVQMAVRAVATAIGAG